MSHIGNPVVRINIFSSFNYCFFFYFNSSLKQFRHTGVKAREYLIFNSSFIKVVQYSYIYKLRCDCNQLIFRPISDILALREYLIFNSGFIKMVQYSYAYKLRCVYHLHLQVWVYKNQLLESGIMASLAQIKKHGQALK